MPLVAVGVAGLALATGGAAAIGAVVAGTATLAVTLSAVAAVGAVVGAIGAVTGDKTLSTIGMVVGGIGGVGALAANAGLFGAAATTESLFGSTVGSELGGQAARLAAVDSGVDALGTGAVTSSLINGGADFAQGAGLSTSAASTGDFINDTLSSVTNAASGAGGAGAGAGAAGAADIARDVAKYGVESVTSTGIAPVADAVTAAPALAATSALPSPVSLTADSAPVSGGAEAPQAPKTIMKNGAPDVRIPGNQYKGADGKLYTSNGTQFLPEAEGGVWNFLKSSGGGMLGMGVLQSAGAFLQGATDELKPAQIEAYKAQAAANNASAAMTQRQVDNMNSNIPVARRVPVTGTPRSLINGQPAMAGA